ncbi:threonine ammonia-lyase [Yinghuangia seranimata]|uniref:threonine ammonia-lyase n=1 Tax=Yinghuangia seranimata TaxID=408067 RepID=UPI00248CC0A3|nr:threonine ammonia-lyase [Yinghuangia seranimata]MDI2128829.1 threonine ammonia-lyase [Yinghuangia seranimata]
MSTPAPAHAHEATAPVTLDDIRVAHKLLDGVARSTPLEGCRALTDRIGGPVYLKCENLQRTGSFKIRGAFVRISGLSEEERARGVVAASAGNHAQGVALAAQLLGVRSTVFMPAGAPLPKIAATRGYGAEVLLEGTTVEHCLTAAKAYAEATGAVFIHPFDHPDVVAGQGTVGLEILEQCPEVRTILVGTGGGGLLAGVAVAVKALRPDVKVIGVQAASAAAYPPSLAAGHPVTLPSVSTMADGIAVGRPGEVPFSLISELVDDVRTVGEESLSQALLLCMERAKLVVEPAGAASVAALLEAGGTAGATAYAPIEAPVVAVLSGGNVDPLLMLRVLRHGMAAAGRYMLLRVRIPDRPGALATLLATLADTDANVGNVTHVRTGAKLQLGEVEVELQLETKGPEHCRAVVAHIAEAGYPVIEG